MTYDQMSESTPLLVDVENDHRIEESSAKQYVTPDEQALVNTAVGERLPYNDYTTIDWLHDLVKDSYRHRTVHGKRGIRFQIVAILDSSTGWIAAAIIGVLMAIVAFLVDVAQAVVTDWKLGYCKQNPFMTREACCQGETPLVVFGAGRPNCSDFHEWSSHYAGLYATYVGFALAFGLISALVTTLTKRTLPAASPGIGDKQIGDGESVPGGKTMLMAAGSGIPEIKTILSGFVIPHFLDFRVLVVKAVGAIFAVSTGMCLGKEGPFVHISTCVGYLVARIFPKYRNNGRKMREMLSTACASGLSCAFGAPIGGVLFAYEEISTYFPRKVLWRAFLCSLAAAIVLKALNPTGTGKLVLFETGYGTTYQPLHYLVFIGLGVAGGIFGGIFCRANYYWGRFFRSFTIIKENPVLEVLIIVLVTAVVQFPNPLIRDPGDMVIKHLLVSCNEDTPSSSSWLCKSERDGDLHYIGWLIHGTVAKLILTIITFGVKVPSGIIIPSLDAGALFGRLVGQWIPTISPGIFALVSAAAFLAGVSRMTISLCVIMFELTGELETVVPHMLAILVAKWVADAIGRESVYNLAQSVLGHPFLGPDQAMEELVGAMGAGSARGNARDVRDVRDVRVEVLVPPLQTMEEVTLEVGARGRVQRRVLGRRLALLERRGLLDAGLVLVGKGRRLRGYLGQGELAYGLRSLGGEEEGAEEGGPATSEEVQILPPHPVVEEAAEEEENETEAGTEIEHEHEGILDLSPFVDRTPLTVFDQAPLEYAVEMFGRLGLKTLIVTSVRDGSVVGVIIKKRLVAYLDGLKGKH